MDREELQEELLGLIAQLNPIPVSSSLMGIRRTISQEDVAYCLAKIPYPGPSYYGRLKFAGHEVWAKDSAIVLSKSLLENIHGNKPKRPFIGHSIINRICEASIWEHMGNTLCPSCNGKKDFRNGNLLVICGTCEGFGVVSASTNRHKTFNMEKHEWDRRWNPIYIKALRILDRWQFRVLRGLIQEFGGPVVRAYLYDKVA